MDIGERIKEIRKGLHQEEFARRVKVSKMTVGRWERGERVPDYSNLVDILAEFPEISSQWLLAGEGPMLSSDLQQSGKLDRELLEMSIQVVEDHEEKNNIRLSARQKANTITLLYEEAFENQALRKAFGKQLEKKSIKERLMDKFMVLVETIKGG